MLELTGKDYGLTPAPGHTLREVEPADSSMTVLAPGELAELQARAKARVRQPWQVDKAA